jgi:hypothetical protein
VKKIVLKISIPMTNFNCTQDDCSGVTVDYITYDKDGMKHKMTVDFQSFPSRESYRNGNKSSKFSNFGYILIILFRR